MNGSQLLLDQKRSQCLLRYIQQYRRYTLTQQTPSPGRNTTQRSLQMLQGRLIQESEKAPQSFLFPVQDDEARVLKTMIVFWLQAKQREPQSRHVQEAIVELTGFKGMLDHLSLFEHQKKLSNS